MITTLQIEVRYAEMRAAQFREEALEWPEGSQERRDCLGLAWSHQERADRLGRIDRVRRGIFPAG
jgi:hypothetical protein